MASNKYDESSVKINREDRDKIRQSPTMYIPSQSVEGALSIFSEPLSNSIDELDNTDVGSDILVTFDEKTKEISVKVDGRGVALGELYELFTIISASGKFSNDETTAYTTSGGIFGTGSCTMVYLSTSCTIRSSREGKYLEYEFKDGICKGKKEGKTKEHGTYVRFTIDQKFCDINSLTIDHIKDLMEEKSYLFPDIRMKLVLYKNGKQVKDWKFVNNDIADWVASKKPDTEILRIKTKRTVTYLKNIDDDKLTSSKVDVDIALAFKEEVLDKGPDEFIITCANSIKTYMGGTHLDGCRDGIVKWFRQCVVPNFKGKDKDLQVTPTDITAGLCAFIAVKASHVVFRAQHKDKLDNAEIRIAVRDAVFEALRDAKPSVTNPMAEFIKRVAKGRVASKKVRKKNVDNAFSKDKPKKYKPINYTVRTTWPEVLLAEG